MRDKRGKLNIGEINLVFYFLEPSESMPAADVAEGIAFSDFRGRPLKSQGAVIA